MVDLFLATLGLGIAGLDPFGALIVAAALTAGSTRRATSAFLTASAATTVAVGGLLGSALEPLLNLLGRLLDFPDLVWAVINIVLVITLMAWAIARIVRPPNSAHHSELPRRTGLSAWSLTGAGVLFGLTMLTDPAYYAIIALGTRVEDWLALVLAVTLWFLISQLPLVLLVVSSFLGLHETLTTRLERLWARVKPHISSIVTAAIALIAGVLTFDTIHFFTRGEFLIG